MAESPTWIHTNWDTSGSNAWEDQLLNGIPEAFRNFETHSDRAVKLPVGAATLARNDYGAYAFRTESTYGVQVNPKLVPSQSG